MINRESFEPLFNSVKASFDFILRLNLQKGTYTVVFPYESDGFESSSEYAYSEFANGFANRYSSPKNKKYLEEALSLETVKEKLANSPEYEVFGGAEQNSYNPGYKKLLFVLAEDKNYASVSVSDFGDVADYYNRKLQLIRNENRFDSLTGAYVRNYYETDIKQTMLCGGVALIDIDDFKICNDTYGHDAGDTALSETAKVILKNISKKDYLVRFGGDEFLLVLPHISEKDMNALLEKIRSDVSEVRHGGLGNMRLTVSIGGVMSDNRPTTDAVRRADHLMYIAKRHKNSVTTENQLKSGVSYNTDDTDGKPLVLIVDDSSFNRDLLRTMLEKNFSILEAGNGDAALSLINTYGAHISIVLLDILMPGLSGFDVLAEMNLKHFIDDIPVVVITVDDSDENIRRAFDYGAADYICRPFDAKVVERRIRNTVALYAKQRRAVSVLAEQRRNTEKIGNITIGILDNAVSFINGENERHTHSIRKITAMLLERLSLKTDRYNISPADRTLISLASAFHDIGKIGIRSEILSKPAKLTAAEYEEVKKHTLIGEKILTDGALSEFHDEQFVKIAKQICRSHHERYDGKGYPDGLLGDDIPIAAQVVSVADVFDALISERSYKVAYSPSVALKMIKDGECGTFNPLLIECLEEIFEDLVKEVCEITRGQRGDTWRESDSRHV